MNRHIPMSRPPRRPFRSAIVAVLALSICLVAVGCGGSSPTTSRSGTAASPAASKPAAPAAAPSATGGSSSRSAIVSQCAAQAGTDPASLSLCLAKHHITLPSGGKLVTCAQAAKDSADLIACLKQGAVQ